ncbi:nuclear transport factor 2 family protein [Haliea salexigens]|uniref:nuclear transport factor 2 family protein n=1 Tax=Haliea salexigens TaxID=287487 RepID=UPI0004205F31|nr:nuclear transport factor 2 family protein [Haliea salexigens]|tara:strand:+ start:45960 stop:46352 length:393 start_codon:yes stop_codon:yes gene_type:complete
MTPEELHAHLQHVYFDNVDTANPAGAVLAFTRDMHWQHTQVWPHDGHDSRHTDHLHGRAALLEFMQTRVKEMQVIRIRHRVDEVIVQGDRGAFRASVLDPSGRSLGFLGWIELSDGLIHRYLVVPEDSSR